MGDLLELLLGRGVVGVLVWEGLGEGFRPILNQGNLPGWYFRAPVL